MREIENLVHQNFFGERFGQEAAADGVGGQGDIDFTVRALGAVFFYFIFFGATKGSRKEIRGGIS